MRVLGEFRNFNWLQMEFKSEIFHMIFLQFVFVIQMEK